MEEKLKTDLSNFSATDPTFKRSNGITANERYYVDFILLPKACYHRETYLPPNLAKNCGKQAFTIDFQAENVHITRPFLLHIE